MSHHVVSEDAAGLELPVPALSCRAQSIFVEPGPVLPGAARVSLGDIATDGTQRPVQLIGRRERAPIGGETTVIALSAELTQTGRFPALDLVSSGTLRPELLVGDGGAEEIVRARAKALED